MSTTMNSQSLSLELNPVICERCKQDVKDWVKCEDLMCPHHFHPSCALLFMTSSRARQCCKDFFKNPRFPPTTSQQPLASTIPPNNLLDMSRITVSEIILPPTQRFEMPANWDTMSDRDRSTHIMQQLIDSRNDNAIVLSEVHKIGIAVNNQAQVLQSQDQRIVNLENFKTEAVNEVNQLKTVISGKSPLTDLTIDGIPNPCAADPVRAVSEVLNKLGMGDMMRFLVGTREFKRKQPAACATIVAEFSSENVCDKILRAHRGFIDSAGKTQLTSAHIFTCADIFNIYINKLLPSNTYKLLSEARKRKRVAQWKAVYVKSGVVRARKDDSSNEVTVSTNSDLQSIV